MSKTVVSKKKGPAKWYENTPNRFLTKKSEVTVKMNDNRIEEMQQAKINGKQSLDKIMDQVADPISRRKQYENNPKLISDANNMYPYQ